MDKNFDVIVATSQFIKMYKENYDLFKPNIIKYFKDKKYINLFYVEMKSNIQFYTLLFNIKNQKINNQDKSILHNRLYRLFYTVFEEYNFYNLINEILNKKLNDEKILYKIFGTPLKTKSQKSQKSQKYFFKDKYMIDDAKVVYRNIKTSICKKKKCKKKFKNILDFGGGNCRIIKELGNLFNLTTKNIHCCDVKDRADKDGIKFKLIVSNKKLPYKNNSFDCILIRKVVSYVRDLDFTLSELSRILSKNGILYIEEYSAINDFDYLICDIQRLSEKYKKNILESRKKYWAKYYDNFELRNILNTHGFNFINESDKFWNISKGLSATNMMWSIYYKNKLI